MGILPDNWIREMALKRGMIEPFAEGKPRKGRISFGTTSYGYDYRLAAEFRVPEFDTHNPIDPKRIGQLQFADVRQSSIVIPGHRYILGRSLEYFRIPRDVLVICQGKSTYARCGLIVNVTPFEPEWEGYATIALVNSSPSPVKVYAGEGIAQIIFLRAEAECNISYADKRGKYQAQRRIELSKI